MTHNVTQWFVDQTVSKSPGSIVRKFIIGTSDYSNHVTRWPTFRNTWDEVRPNNLSITCANEDGVLSVLRTDKTVLTTEGKLQFGFSHPQSGEELIDLFTGKVENVRYSKGAVDITLTDKFRQITERLIGTSDVPVNFTNSNYLPSDIAWFSITSYGGYSNVMSSSNPDIDYDSWRDWSNVFSSDAVFMNANFTGQKVGESLRKISRLTKSAIFVHDNRISFHRFTLADTNISSFGDDSIKELDLEFSRKDIVNKQYIYADFDVTSKFFKTTVFDIDSDSIASYGLREQKDEDKVVWYVGTGPALNAAQRTISISREPHDGISVQAPMIGINRRIGEMISIKDSFHGIDSSLRIMEETINTETGLVKLVGNVSQVFNSFILDVSTLNSPEILI